MDQKISDSIDARAAARWAQSTHASKAATPWLHDEVGTRVAERLEMLQLQPTAWANWHYPRGGAALQLALQQRWPQALAYCPSSNTIGNIAAQADLTA